MRRRALIALTLFVLLSGTILALLFGASLASPWPTAVGPAPRGFDADEVRITSGSGSVLHGWYVPAGSGDESRAVLLMHGVRANRLQMLTRARFLREAGYATLLFDFQAHGESPGEHVTFGWLESRDAHAALQYLRARLPRASIGAIGLSMGGAAALLGPRPLDADALILEETYTTIEEAVSNRVQLTLGGFDPLLSPLLTLQLRPRLGISAGDLRPVERIPFVTAPVFVLAGSQDLHVTIGQSRRLFAAAPEPREWWEIEGAGHQDFHSFGKAEYERRVLDFLADALDSPEAD